MGTSEDLSDIFTKEGINKLTKGQLLRFEKAEFIITRLNKKSGIVMAKEVHTKHPDQVSIEDAFGDKEDFDMKQLKEDVRHA